MKSVYAARRPVKNAYLVRERDRRRVRELLLVLAGLLPLGLALIVYTWIHLESLRIAYRTAADERRLRQLQQSERELRLEAAYLASPERVAARAQAELGMQAPTVDQTVFAEELHR